MNAINRLTISLCCLAMVLWSKPIGAVERTKEEMKKDLALADDITKESIAGPGKIQVVTTQDLLMSFGATVRIIPTSESNWDFGMSKQTDGYLLNNLDKSLF